MASLWRILAMAWLGGIASPVLTDDPMLFDAANPEIASSQSAPIAPVLGEREVGSDEDPEMPSAAR